MRRRAVVWSLAAGLAACGTGNAELDRFLAREQVRCGVIDLVASACPAASAQPIACFNAAVRDGHAGTVSWRQFSVEGDSIVTAVFSTPGEPGVVVFHDTRADAFGPREVTSSRCDAVLVSDSCAWPAVTGCTAASP